jgi:hypothetical protein
MDYYIIVIDYSCDWVPLSVNILYERMGDYEQFFSYAMTRTSNISMRWRESPFISRPTRLFVILQS